tara:strand:+ start:4727 stop:6475 length:1749 start_codon:yes stop_codon:yes gene_type:complete
MSDAVQQIKDKISIIDVVSPYVELHKAGKNFKGKSPFSAEKTPSFYVSPDRGMYYCFSTSQGGDIFNFVQAMEGVDFKEALKQLADKAGVELVPEDPKKKTEREKAYSIMDEAVKFYVDKLEEESEALEYLKKRGVKDETVHRWQIGFAPGPPKGGWRELKEYLEKKDFTKEQQLAAGLIKTTEGGKEPFDVFRDRIVFPMAEPSGKVVAFSGRILHPNDKAPKYVNSPETLLYKKSELLFGYDKAKSGIRNLNFSLVVEGQFDVVMCHQAGYSNTVAVSGTALTLHHVQLLERMSDKVVLALDADRAGIAAMKKAADLMLQRGIDVKVAELPLGKDPADLIQEDPALFKKYIGKSVHVIEFLLHVLKREHEDERSFKLKVRDEVLPFVLLLPNRIDQEHFVNKIAKEIDSTTEAVRFELNHLREKKEAESHKETYYGDSYDENVGVDKGERGQDDGSKSRLFLLAAALVVDDAQKQVIEAELDKLVAIKQLADPSESDLAKTVFTLEQQFSNLPPLAVKEEIINKFNRLKKILVRSKLAELREDLQRLEAEGGDVNKVLKLISVYESKLREPDYTSDIFQN